MSSVFIEGKIQKLDTGEDAKYSYTYFQIYYHYLVILGIKSRLCHMLGKHSTGLIFKSSYQYFSTLYMLWYLQ